MARSSSSEKVDEQYRVTHVFRDGAHHLVTFDKAGVQAAIAYTTVEVKGEDDKGRMVIEFTHFVGARTEAS